MLYLTANNIADDNADRRKAIFLSEVGRGICHVLSVLGSPDKAASKTLDQLLKKLKDHCEPMQNEMAESFKCWTPVQKDNESITDYSLAMKKLTVHANFPDLNRWLRDRIVTALNRNHAAVQVKLSNMTNLTFERKVEIAVNITMVYDDARQFHFIQIRKMFPMWQDRTYCEVNGLQRQIKGEFCY